MVIYLHIPTVFWTAYSWAISTYLNLVLSRLKSLDKLKRYKSPGTDQILADMIQAECNSFHSEIHKFINSIFILIYPVKR